MPAIGKLLLKNLSDGSESKGFMLLITYNLHKGDKPYSQALLSDGKDTVFALDNKLDEPNHKYPEGNAKKVVYVKLKRDGDAYSIENILPADEPSLSGSCNLTVADFVYQESQPEKQKQKPEAISSLAMNERAELNVLVTAVTAKRGTVKPFIEVSLSDGKTTINAKDFNNKTEDYQIGKVINAEVRLDKYGYSIEKFSLTDISPDAYVKHPPVKEEDMYDYIVEVLKELADRKGERSIANLGLYLYEQNKEKLLYWSASKSMHHDLLGGLLYHTYRMLNLAERMLEVYTNLNEELLLTAVAIHDIGKLKELNTDELGIATYTNLGNLLGHTVIGIEMIDQAAQKGDYDQEMVTLLKHCIGAHHGKLEFNAVVLPKIEEAFFLHIIDYTDSRAYMFESAYMNIESGKSGEKKDVGLEAVIYKPTFTQED